MAFLKKRISPELLCPSTTEGGTELSDSLALDEKSIDNFNHDEDKETPTKGLNCMSVWQYVSMETLSYDLIRPITFFIGRSKYHPRPEMQLLLFQGHTSSFID